jgi:soluble lytic murein transglycosylase
MSRARRATLASLLAAASVLVAARQLAPTDHPQVPSALGELWFVPHTVDPGPLANAAAFLDSQDFDKALDVLAGSSLPRGAVDGYVDYLVGLAQMGLEDPESARESFRAAVAARGPGALGQIASLAEAEADEALGDPEAAIAVYEAVAARTSFRLDAVLLRLANAAVEAGDSGLATRVYEQLYFDYPLTDAGAAAAAALAEGPGEPLEAGSDRYRRELVRAEQLLAARRYRLARNALEALVNVAGGADRELVDLHLAEADYFTGRYRDARDRAKRYMNGGAHRAEAMFYWARAVRSLRATDAAVRTLRQIVALDPTSSWAEDALNELGTIYVVDDEDEAADAVFRELYDAFPTGRYGARAAWKTGWWAYTHRRYAETVRIFERAAGDFPRSDYRPSWLYWLGRSYEALGDASRAQQRYALAFTDYANSYYGRLADRRLTSRPAARVLVAKSVPTAAPPPNLGVIRDLLSAGLFDQAVDELRYAQVVWGNSAALEATLAWSLGARGDLRAGINAMKRAYPQFMAAGGEDLPFDVLKVLFPVDYWPLIQQFAAEHHLDPYLMAALVAQESTFDARIRSSANAYGLMQLLPATARRYAPRVGLRYASRLLTSPEANLRMGMAYFADLVEQFGDVSLALAGYNAGEQRVVKWQAERPTLDRDEFIDDMPFPETQNYVRRILGTAEDYRRMYGPASLETEQH